MTILAQRPYIGVRLDGDPGQGDHSREEPKKVQSTDDQRLWGGEPAQIEQVLGL